MIAWIVSLWGKKRSLVTHSILWIIVPQFLVLIAIALVIFTINQRIVVSLLIDRDHQLAMISGSRISQAIKDYASKLEFVADEYFQLASEGDVDEGSLDQILKALDLTKSAIVVLDSSGVVFEVRPSSEAPLIVPLVSQYDDIEIGQLEGDYFNDLVFEGGSGDGVLIISLPVPLPTDEGSGIMMGGFFFEGSPIAELIRGLKVGDEGFAYLINRSGKVLYHPDQDNVGKDFSDRTFASRVMNGVHGGGVENGPAGDRFVIGYAPIEDVGWGLVVREPWEEVTEPIRNYVIIIVLVILFITGVTTRFLWVRMRRITTPIQQLEEQAVHLGAGAKVKPVVNSGFYEIDSLASEFVHMADQVVSYRARLQRHLRAITHSQDEERRRVSRELHDETIQNMLAIDRQLELFLSEGDQDEEAVRIHRIHDMVQETIQGVRQIVRNLRPLMLEDLGLIPAIDSLLSLVHEEEPGLSTHLRISGDKVSLNPEMELAIYRIIQEALANCRKHAWASSVEVAINYQVDEVQLMISDDGRGFDPPISVAEFADQGHFGLMGIHERVNALGGQFQIESRLNHGVRLITHFPLHRSEFGIEIEGELKEILG